MTMTTLHKELLHDKFELVTYHTYRIFSYKYNGDNPIIVVDEKLPNSNNFVSDLIHLAKGSAHVYGNLHLKANSIYAPLHFPARKISALTTSDTSTLALPEEESHCRELTLRGSALTNWSLNGKNSEITLDHSSLDHVTIAEENEQIILRSCTLYGCIIEGYSLRGYNRSAEHNNRLTQPPINQSLFYSYEDLENLVGDTVAAYMYRDIETDKLMVKVGCYEGSVKQFKKLIKGSYTKWPSVRSEWNPNIPKKKVKETRQRYLAWLEDNLRAIDQEFKGLRL